ncbi:serine/threonine protein kinase [Lactiplantibacillus plajomi]|uniref:non-specific serine/threonine protein kinase n=1 Tax=Lactiplantibacillus plajomi TaxID=1457217 RepID=A0ABV6K276_9LACO|nr:protein kinase [Lactiplantibacillus plajomi]
MLPIVQAMQTLTAADYQPLGPLVNGREFPMLVKKDQVVSVAKLTTMDTLPVLQTLFEHPVIRMPKLQRLLPMEDYVVTVETLINGETLADRLTKQGPLASPVVQTIATDVLETLAALAALNIVHRDIKLSNLMLVNGHCFVIDVNAAREFHTAQSTDTRLLGTSGFAAPENYGFAQTDQRSDIYALGIVLNCLLTGKLPTDSQTIQRTLTTVAPWRQIIAKATALDPEQRYQTAEAMRQAINGQSPRPTTGQLFKTFWHQHRVMIIRSGWLVYTLWWWLLLLIGLDQSGWSAKWQMWWIDFILFGLPVLAHYLNLRLYRHWPNVRRYRVWLRAGETIVILMLLGL